MQLSYRAVEEGTRAVSLIEIKRARLQCTAPATNTGQLSSGPIAL